MRMSELINLWNKKHKQNKHICFYHDPLNMIVNSILHRYPFCSEKGKSFFMLYFFSPLNRGEFYCITWRSINLLCPNGSASSIMIFFFLNKRWKTASTKVNKKVIHHNQWGQVFLLLTYLHFLFNLKNFLIHKYCIFIEQQGREYGHNQKLIFNWDHMYHSASWQPQFLCLELN